LVRVGNDEYAAANNSYSLTTMHKKHAEVDPREATSVSIFRAKGGKQLRVNLHDRRGVFAGSARASIHAALGQAGRGRARLSRLP